MSWIDKINNIELEIITGDGRSHKPLWKDAKKNINYNTEGFDFIDLDGTYVERKRKSGNQFPFLIYFQGKDHLQQCLYFENGAADPRPWTINHPFYGKLTVQPLSLEIDHSTLNISKITGTLWETITLEDISTELSPLESIKSINAKLTNDVSLTWNNDLKGVNTSIIEPSKRLNIKIGSIYENLPLTVDEFTKLKDLARLASGTAQNIVSDLTSYIDATINLVRFPNQIKQNILFSIKTLANSFEAVYDLIFNENKKSYESISNIIFGTMCENSIVSASDKNINLKRSDIYSITATIESLYNDLIAKLDTFDANYINSIHLDNLINTTIASLIQATFDAKQERSTILTEDSNIILLANKYFGAGDEKLQEFIDNNNVSLDELIIMEAGRKIYWYV